LTPPTDYWTSIGKLLRPSDMFEPVDEAVEWADDYANDLQ